VGGREGGREGREREGGRELQFGYPTSLSALIHNISLNTTTLGTTY
jgi:hypothetical protein